MTAQPTADAARDLFATLTGNEPVGTWSAPGRVNLIGEHTDYNDGFVFPFATPHRTHVALGTRTDGRIRVTSTFDPVPVEVALADLDALFPSEDAPRVPEWSAYPLGVAWALLHAAGLSADAVTGVDLAFASDVPVGAGLSSSAAIEGAAATALAETWGIDLDRVTLAKVGRRAENEAVGAPTGIMDQMASMLGQPDAAIFLDCRSLDVHVVDLGFAAAGLELVVIDTHVKHAHATGGYGERRASCEKGAAIMGVTSLRDVSVADLDRARELMDDVTFRRVRHVVTENQRVLDTVTALRADGPRAIGGLLDASHVSMRDDFEISVPELDTAVTAAVAAGAIGARMTGGGFGGSAIALVEHERVAAVTDAVTQAFADAGFAAPHIFTVAPSAGAHRDA
ncbi:MULTISPECIES: galactokinase [unclassified Microbacterium]|uniref:galactokinase n=1 Tax=unclassified Microbacterium TaxID=2609290 RepID=UPI00214B6D98|nr:MULTISPECIES: galactokinase [unclassified Microbacterium]MCR2783458.1 galactokinase [Microbacterium sp. zg.B96]MDL5351755.1 galactokinase [Microbacterium sp. zg-YB36]WIM15676.1 galactokinase [Microbacterium sp. zg-B96]